MIGLEKKMPDPIKGTFCITYILILSAAKVTVSNGLQYEQISNSTKCCIKTE